MPPKRTDNIEMQLPFLDRYERIDMLSRVEGFIPTTAGELTEVTGLLSFDAQQGGAARHLAEIIRHQQEANTNDPQRAARKIVRNYINYAEDAKQSASALNELQSVLGEVLNPELILDRVVEPTQPGLLKFLRFFDLHTLQTTGGIEQVGYDPMKVVYSKDNAGIMHYLGQSLEVWRVHQVRTKLPFAVEDQNNRFAFFEARLGEVVKHFPYLRPIAQSGLDKLHTNSDE